MEIYYGIPTYKRVNEQITLAFLKEIGIDKEHIILATQTQGEYEACKALYEKDCTVIYGEAHNASGNRNTIIDYLPSDTNVLILDDDLSGFEYNDCGELKPLGADKVKEVVEGMFKLTRERGGKLWSVYPVRNAYFMQEAPVVKLNKAAICVLGVITSDLRFDENQAVKEDYLFVCENLAKGYPTLRLENVVSVAKHLTNAGGCKDQWGTNEDCMNALLEKFPQYVKANTKREGEVLLKNNINVGGGGKTFLNVKFNVSDEIKKTYGSPRWTGEITDCSLPMTFDTYSNCSFGCIYCFSQYQRGIGAGKNDYLAKKVESVNPKKLRRVLTEPENNQFWEYVKDKRPIQYGGLSDQFDGFEKKYGVTYECLKILKELNYPVCFSTKGTWVFFDEKYRELFRGQDNWNVKFSIITLDEKKASIIEQGVPSPKERLRAMKEYTTLNKGGATLRLRPFILGVTSNDYLELIEAAHEAGATAVTTEFFCLERRAVNTAKEHYKTLSDCCGFDIVDFYAKNSDGQGYLRLNRQIKEPYIKNMRELCDKLGMRFYVSDAHFKEVSDNGCCCALPPEWEYSRGNFAYALQLCKRKGECRWSDIEGDMYFLNFLWNDADGFNTGSAERRAKFSGITMKGYLHYLWNNPKMGQSPYKMFGGVMRPNGFDENGDIIYIYDERKTFQPCGGGCTGCTQAGFFDTID